MMDEELGTGGWGVAERGAGGSASSHFPVPSRPLRVLLVTYYFPPSGGAGVQRPLKWVRYLPAAGVETVVLTVRAGAYPHLDAGMAADVPRSVEVYRTHAPDPFGLYGRLTGRSRDEAVAARTGQVGQSERLAERASRWVRANVFVPDARVGWVPFALARAVRLHRRRPFDAVVTTGPPHSAHLVGLALKARLGVPWLADFRDPWTQIHYTGALGRSALAERLDGRLEARVLRTADAVVTVSEPLRHDLEALAPGVRVAVVRNGFDPADFAGPPPVVDRLEVAYVGALYDVPTTLLDAVARLRGDGTDVRLRFIGKAPEALMAEAGARGIADLLSVEPAVPHADAVDAMRRTALLLLVVEPWSYAAGVVPGKTFEYLASGRPVLGLGPPDGEAAQIVARAGGGQTFAHGDVDGVAGALRTHAAAWGVGTPTPGAAPEALAPYARPAQAAHVAEILRRIAPRGEQP